MKHYARQFCGWCLKPLTGRRNQQFCSPSCRYHRWDANRRKAGEPRWRRDLVSGELVDAAIVERQIRDMRKS